VISAVSTKSDKVFDSHENNSCSQEVNPNVIEKTAPISNDLNAEENMETATSLEDKSSLDKNKTENDSCNSTCEVVVNPDDHRKSESQECLDEESVSNRGSTQCDQKDDTVQTDSCDGKNAKDTDSSIKNVTAEVVPDKNDEFMES